MSEVVLFDHQREFLDAVPEMAKPVRACLYFKTGAGKSLTAMVGMRVLGQERVLVVAPPSTHEQWLSLGRQMGMDVDVMSHARFRMKGTALSRSRAVIADEFHMFGGQQGQGWRKLDALSRQLQAPMFLLSATPNYNDAERVYCVQRILDPQSCRGGYLQFLYQHCETVQNPFGMTPEVTGFRNGMSASEYLASLPGVFHLPDDAVCDIRDVSYDRGLPDELVDFGYNRRDHRMVASIIEMRHVSRFQGLVDEQGLLRGNVLEAVLEVVEGAGPVLIYSDHATIAEALARSLEKEGMDFAIVTGKTSRRSKEELISSFRTGGHSILIGTATLATGTDGMDRVCNTLLIIDDTDDDSLRRQLIGRILPRGDRTSEVEKVVVRLLPS